MVRTLLGSWPSQHPALTLEFLQPAVSPIGWPCPGAAHFSFISPIGHLGSLQPGTGSYAPPEPGKFPSGRFRNRPRHQGWKGGTAESSPAPPDSAYL